MNIDRELGQNKKEANKMCYLKQKGYGQQFLVLKYIKLSGSQ